MRVLFKVVVRVALGGDEDDHAKGGVEDGCEDDDHLDIQYLVDPPQSKGGVLHNCIFIFALT